MRNEVQRLKKPSAAVYRRRRLVVVFMLLIFVILCVVIVSALTGIFLDDKNSRVSIDGVSSPADAQASKVEGDGKDRKAGDECVPSNVVVSAFGDAKTYPDNQAPRFSVTIENKNSVGCEINLGTKTMDYVISQGGRQIFSSQDCAAGELTDWPRVLAAGSTVTVEDFMWRRTITQQGCPESSMKTNQALASTYSLIVHVGDYVSDKVDFVLK